MPIKHRLFEYGILLICLFFYTIVMGQENIQLHHFDGCSHEMQFNKKNNTAKAISGKFNPMLIDPSDNLNTTRYTIHIDGKPDSVRRDYFGSYSLLNDDGINGDTKADDNVYTVEINESEILNDYQLDDVNKPFAGFIELYDQGNLIGKYNTFASIWADTIPLVNVYIDSNIQFTDHIVNMITPLAFDSDLIDHHESLASELYDVFDDNYDFLNFIYTEGFFQNRGHYGVKNMVLGIGLDTFDRTQNYGSLGQLKGISTFPNLTFYDGANRGYVHELGHQWVNFSDDTAMGQAVPHWPYSSMGSGIMGITIPGGAGGNFHFIILEYSGGFWGLFNDTNAASDGFSTLGLYFMGLIAPSEINRIYVLRDQSTYPSQGIYPNTFAYKVPMEDIITANGQRFPDHLNSQKYFNVGSVVLSTEELSQKEMSYLDFFTQRASATKALMVSEGFTKGIRKPFYAATEGRASLTTSIYNTEFCLDGMTLSETFVDPDYIANDFIISNAIIDDFTEYQSRCFTLLPDFEVILGATFESFLNSCK